MSSSQRGEGDGLFRSIYIPNTQVRNVITMKEPSDENILVAAKEGRVQDVVHLFEDGADIRARDEVFSTPMHLAAEGGHEDVIKLLLQLGVNIDEVNHHGNTPLHLASLRGRTGTVRLLARRGATVDAKNLGRQTPLLLASWKGHTNVVRDLVNRGADLNAVAQYGLTALHQASNGNHVDTVDWLLALGADVEAKSDAEWTALNFAVQNDGTETVRLLIDEGKANVNTRDPAGTTPLHFASSDGFTETVKVLLDCPSTEVDARDKVGRTPLHMASRLGHVETVRILLKGGADIHAMDSTQGKTPLHCAVENGQVDVAKLLLDHGADLYATTTDGLSPLDIATDTATKVAGGSAMIAHELRLYQEQVRLETLKPKHVFNIGKGQSQSAKNHETNYPIDDDMYQDLLLRNHDLQEQLDSLHEQYEEYEWFIERTIVAVDDMSDQIEYLHDRLEEANSTSSSLSVAGVPLWDYMLLSIFVWCCWKMFGTKPKPNYTQAVETGTHRPRATQPRLEVKKSLIKSTNSTSTKKNEQLAGLAVSVDKKDIKGRATEVATTISRLQADIDALSEVASTQRVTTDTRKNNLSLSGSNCSDGESSSDSDMSDFSLVPSMNQQESSADGSK